MPTNSAHWHLLLNHIPVLGTWFGLALLVAAMILRNTTLLRASWVTFVVCAAMAIPVYLTGEPAEEIVEHLAGVSEPIIEQHEDLGKIALIAMEALGALSLAALVVSWRREAWARTLSIFTLLVALLCGGVMGYTANLGGKIRHSEIRGDAAAGTNAAGENERENGREEGEH